MFCRAVLATLAMLLIGIIGGPSGASAHPSVSSVTLAAPPPAVGSAVSVAARPRPSLPSGSTGLAVLLIAGMTVSSLRAARSRRRPKIRIVVLLLVLILTGFEGAIHAVHHLGDPAAADRCLVAATSEHLAAVDSEVPRVTYPILEVVETALPTRPARRGSVWRVPHDGRGPPA
jgi:hypothetical protein